MAHGTFDLLRSLPDLSVAVCELFVAACGSSLLTEDLIQRPCTPI